MNNTCLHLGTAYWLIAVFSIAFGAEREAGNELVQAVVALLGDPDKDVRALGLEQVRTGAKGPAATRSFSQQLPRLTPEGRIALLGALAARGDRAARPDVLDTLHAAREPSVRVAVIRALGALGQVDDVPLLITLLAEPPEAQQAAARASLIRLSGGEVSSAIAEATARAAPAGRVMLIQILAERRARDTIPQLLAAAVDSHARVRAAGMTALGQLADSRHVANMVRGVLRAEPGAEREAAEKDVMRVCGTIADAQARCEPLLTAMKELPEADQRELLPTLGRVGGDAARKVVEVSVGASDPASHELGIRAICNWPNASIAERLTELAETDRHPRHRIAALRALIRVAPLPDGRSSPERLALLQRAMAMATRDQERQLALKRAQAIRDIATLHFVLPYLDTPNCAQQACLSIVELAHHRRLRESNKAEFHAALEKVIHTSTDATVIDRARRYMRDQTWVRPK